MPLRRLFLVLLIYVPCAVLLDRMMQALVPILVLPPLFLTLERALLGAGLVLAAVVSWTYTPSEETRDPPATSARETER